MTPSLPALIGLTPRANAEKPLKADLRKAESGPMAVEIGAALDAARAALSWSLDRLAAELGRDARQVSRWLTGAERTQVDVVWSVPELRKPFVIALAARAGAVVRTRVEWPEVA
jgi:hypothetical protein